MKNMTEFNTEKKKKIFTQFLYHHTLTFSALEKLTGLRSNDLAYYTQKFLRAGILQKNKEQYILSQEYEKYVPFFSEHLNPLSVILIACKKQNKILLLKRDKRPYKKYWGLIGGRMHMGESIETASKRILKEKTYIEGTLTTTNAVTIEHLREQQEIKHSYILILVTMTPTTTIKEKENIKWFPIKKIPARTTIPSDYWLINNKLDETITISEEEITEGTTLKMKMQ